MKDKIFDDRLKNFIRGFIGLFVYFFLNFFLGRILTMFGVNVAELTRKQSLLISMGVSIFIIIVLVLLSWKTLKKNWKDYKKNWKELLGRNVKYWVCAYFIMAALNAAISIIFNRLTSANDQTIRDLFKILPVYITIEAAIIAPILEELTFRQSIRHMIKNKWVFIIISAVLFGFMHTLSSLESLSDFLYIIPYSIPGGFFAYMLYEEDNVLVPITFHMIHNTLAIIFLIIAMKNGII